MSKMYRLLGADGQEYLSEQPGQLGGHFLKERIYGRLDCSAALRALRDAGEAYRAKRVFFADEETAIQAGYRPCGACLRQQHQAWKARHSQQE